MTEIKDSDREIHLFRMRLTAMVVFVFICFGLLVARFVWLQVVKHSQYMAQAEDNRIALVPIVPNRGLIVDRNGVVLASNYSAYTLEITPSKLEANLDSVIDELAKLVDDRAEGPEALQAPAGRVEELFQRADPHPPDRRRGRALHRAALPLPGRGGAGAPVPPVSAGRSGVARAGLHRPHQPGRGQGHRGRRRRRQLQRHRPHRQGRPGEELRAPAARPDRLRGSRALGRRARDPHAVAHGAGRRATT